MDVKYTNYGLTPTFIASLNEIFKHFSHIEQVLLFGSRAKGSFREGSDIDLAVQGAEITAKEFTNIWGQIDALDSMLKIDLLHWDTLQNLALKEKILKEGKKLYP